MRLYQSHKGGIDPFTVTASVVTICGSNNSAYNTYSNDDWIVTCGSGNGTLGSNSNNAESKMKLGDNYVVATPLNSAVTSDTALYAALISKNKLPQGVNKIEISGTAASNMTLGITTSSDGSNWTKLEDLGTETSFTIDQQGAVYFAIVICAKNKSNATYKNFVAKFSHE